MDSFSDQATVLDPAVMSPLQNSTLRTPEKMLGPFQQQVASRGQSGEENSKINEWSAMPSGIRCKDHSFATGGQEHAQ